MADVSIKFEPANRDGIVPVGTYLSDAARRLGIRFEDSCIPAENLHFCVVTLTEGADLVSPETAAELRYFETHERQKGERLACQTKAEKPGELIIMTKSKEGQESQNSEETEETSEQFKKEFAAMPFEQKIANLVQLEAIALGQTFSLVMNSPFMLFDKVMDIMSEFGLRKEETAREAARPREHKEPGDDKASAAKSAPDSPPEQKGSAE